MVILHEEHLMACVYVIGMEGTDFVKIGYTDGPVQDRLKALQPGTPFRLKVLATYPCDHAARVERTMHRLLAASHHDHEWFALADLTELETIFTEACALTLPPCERVPPLHAAQLQATGQRIALSRRALGLTQKDLAELCGFPYQVINRVRTGSSRPLCTTPSAYRQALRSAC